jgi:hypothetical protein
LPLVNTIVEIQDEAKFPANINAKDLMDAIKIIEDHTGIKLSNDVSLKEISYKDFLKIVVVSKIIDTVLLLYRPILITMTKAAINSLILVR